MSADRWRTLDSWHGGHDTNVCHGSDIRLPPSEALHATASMSVGSHSVSYMIIDCDTCEVRDKACGDCVVSFLTIGVRPGALASAGPAPAGTRTSAERHSPFGVAMDADQSAAVDALVAGGLVPPLRLVHSAAPTQAIRARPRKGRHAS